MNWVWDNWRAFVEILLLAAGIYYCIRLVRGTRGAPVVLGFLLVMLVLTSLTLALNLEVLRLLLRNFLAFFAIAVIVIFQPEVRRIFANLGSLPFFASTRETRQNIEVLIKTVERLSDVRIGMLVAIEQTIQLQDVVESGVPVDCVATPEILETIFFPNNAMHDGGVIMQGDRIAYAACIFPLTRKPGLSASLGTRHRAAIGLSEETDAVVVVVSEETGAISYAHRGELVRNVSIEQLRDFLTSVLVHAPPPRGVVEWVRSLFGRSGVHAGLPADTKPGS